MVGEICVLIVDDEPLARRGIRQLISHRDGFVVIGESKNGRECLEFLENNTPDLVFLDVQMPEFDGFEVIRAHGAERMPAVIFVTAYDAHAVHAFETHAVDYLVKPVSEKRFDAALSRARERINGRNAVQLTKRLQALLTESGRGTAVPPDEPREHLRIVVPTSTGNLVVDAGEIDWISAVDYCAELHIGDRRHLLRESLSSLADRLESLGFVRVHRSVIVNIARVRELRTAGENIALILRNGTTVPVSRRRKELVSSVIRRLHLT